MRWLWVSCVFLDGCVRSHPRAKKKIELKTAWMTEMIRPRWMTNCESLADRLYELRPCHSRSLARYENWLIEKSAAREACLPSLPTMPMPAISYIPYVIVKVAS
jgi:hypothetical protein